jgi:hypothetical protein
MTDKIEALREPVPFLTRTRFKLAFNKAGNCTSLWNFANELDGEWVWLVSAENGKNSSLYSEADYFAALSELDRLRSSNEAMRKALEQLLHAVCGETGFANAVRTMSGTAYPWPALDIAEAEARAALSLLGEGK